MRKTALLISVAVLLMPAAGLAYTVHLDSFQNIDWTKSLTGEVYYTLDGNSSFSYCVDRSKSMPVPHSYYADLLSISPESSLLRAAWILENFAYSLHGTYNYLGRAYSANETGAAVQLAIWDVIGQGIGTVAGYEYLFTLKNYIVGLTPSIAALQGLGLENRYLIMDVYADATKCVAYQDLLTPVPLPGAVWLFGAGLIGLVGLRRKK